jgi:hypothetical protein
VTDGKLIAKIQSEQFANIQKCNITCSEVVKFTFKLLKHLP